MQVYVVAITTSGFAREDEASASALAAFTDPKLAHAVKSLWGSTASVHAVELNVIPKGVLSMASALNITLSVPGAPADAATPEQGVVDAG